MVWRDRTHRFFLGDSAFQHVAAEPQNKDAGAGQRNLSQAVSCPAHMPRAVSEMLMDSPDSASSTAGAQGSC